MNIDMTMRFMHMENDVFLYAEDNRFIIEDGATREKILNLVFPEFCIFEGWDEDLIVRGNVAIGNKEGPIYLYNDGSIIYVVEDDGEITLRYIGSHAEMGCRIDNLKFVKPGVDNWFTTL